MTTTYESRQSVPARGIKSRVNEGIEIVAECGVDARLLDALSWALSENFNTPCHMAGWTLATVTAYNPRRGQYSAEAILRQVNPEGNAHVLAVVDVDIYVPPYGYVLGLAHPEQRRALIALPRLHEQRGYPLAYEAAFRARVVEEAVHQLSRTYWRDPYEYVRRVQSMVEQCM
jgi:predicted Zn-dependent protease